MLHLGICSALQGMNQPTAALDRTPPPPPHGQQLFAKLGKM